MRAMPGMDVLSRLKEKGFPSPEGGGCPRRENFVRSLLLALVPVCLVMAPSQAALTTPSAKDAAGATAPKGVTGAHHAQASGPSFSVDNVTAGPGEEVPFHIDLAAEALAQPGVVMIRGLPDSFSLSAGFRTRNSWMVSPKQLKDLRLRTPEGFEGEVKLELIYIRSGGEPGRVETASIAVQPQKEEGPWDQQPTSTDPAAPITETKPEPEKPRISASAERALLARATKLLNLGDIAGARLLYKHLATMGSATGALNIAKTYDPKVLPALGVIGMKPDTEQARQWYKRAAELGSQAALTRLQAMTLGQ